MLRAARQNRLLAALPDACLRRWLPHLAPVKAGQGQVLHDPLRPSPYAYFPTTALVSLAYRADGGPATEIALIGREGVVGPTPDGATEGSPAQAIVDQAGWLFRLDTQALRGDVCSEPVLQVLLRHARALMTQTAQTSVCGRHHPLDQQLCRWLLTAIDRLEEAELRSTQATLAGKLGVRRGAVNAAALRLQNLGFVRYSRGRISVLDRAGLERHACGCYRLIATEYARLLPTAVAPTDTVRADALSERRLPVSAGLRQAEGEHP